METVRGESDDIKHYLGKVIASLSVVHIYITFFTGMRICICHTINVGNAVR